jgi:hypothetical protein
MSSFDHNATVITARPVMPPPIIRAGALGWFGASMPLAMKARLAWAAVAVICCVILGLAAWLRPDARGFGTHEALGLEPCGFVIYAGLPCPTCGMTTAYSYLMHGRPLAALLAQPAGFALCLGTIVLAAWAAVAAARGRMPIINWERVGAVRLSLTVALVLVGGWAIKLAIGLATGALPLR